ncbi:hypothetical protein XfCFBP7970_005270 [Xylella fastidiosa subsp. fastidiosa]
MSSWTAHSPIHQCGIFRYRHPHLVQQINPARREAMMAAQPRNPGTLPLPAA